MPERSTTDSCGRAAGEAPTKHFISVAIFVLPALLVQLQRWHRERQRIRERERAQRNSSLIRKIADDGRPIRPPLPDVVRTLLSHCRLAFLSTVEASGEGDTVNASAHLSLMRFTYIPGEEVIVMSTNRRTKKFELLQRQRGVALLVHDFGQFGTDGEGRIAGYSITLNGECHIESGEDAERHRAAHLKHNPDYPQFIVGEDIAILCINVSSARICNINDQVVKWNIGGAEENE